MPGINDFVSVVVSLSQPVGLLTQTFGVGMIAAFHTHYPDRIRFYTDPSGMVQDGFLTTEPAYAAAQIYFAQTPKPGQLAIGRRANAPAQTLVVTLSSQVAIGDLYQFTVEGSDDVAHAISVTATGNQTTDAATMAALFPLSPTTSSGTSPPAVTITGTPLVNGAIEIDIQTPGARGTATFQWKINGQIQQIAQVTAATFALGTTGLTANFPNSTYAADNVYKATAILNVGTVSAMGSAVTFAQSGGKLNDIIGWTTNLTLQDTTADPGLTADLAAITAANPLGWYGLALDSNSSAEVLAAETFIEATGQGGKFGFFNNSDSIDVQYTSSDLFSQSQLKGFQKSFIEYSGKEVLGYGGVSAMSYALGSNPGSYTLAYKSQPGVTADDDVSLTETQRLALNTMTVSSPGTGAKNGNYYAKNSGVLMVWPGVTPGGRFADLSIFLDWLTVNVQAAVFKTIASLPKVPLTDHGIGLVQDAILGVIRLASTPAYNAVDTSQPIAVVVPKASDLSPSDRAARNLSGVSFSFTYSGAIQTVVVKGVLST